MSIETRTREQALQLLGLQPAVAPGDIELALLERVTQVEKRLAIAPTDVLRAKYQRQLDELEAARALLLDVSIKGGLTHTMLADLPAAHAAMTRTASSAPAGANAMALRPGQVLAERYRLIEQIGNGGMGCVFSAFDINRGKDIAIKVLQPYLLSSPKARERFLREARLASELSHPNIATVFDVQQDGVFCFLTMELLHGKCLRTHLRQLREQRTPMAVDEALRIIGDVCQSLSYAHERTVHRDIKPENIWLGEDGKAKIMDFGIALLTDGSGALETTVNAGTPYYMAPEQLAGTGNVDARADQYSVAIMLYEMLSGLIPSGRMESLRTLRKDVPRALSDAVDRAMSQRAEQRYSSMAQFHAALTARFGQKFLGGRTLALAVGIGLAIVLAATFPYWRAALPDRGGQAALKNEVATLQGEVKSLMKLVENQRKETKDGLAAAEREFDRLSSQLRAARSSDEQAHLKQLMQSSSNEVALAKETSRQLAQLDTSGGMVALAGNIAAAESALKDGNVNLAKDKFTQVKQVLEQIRQLPEAVRLAMTQPAVAPTLGLATNAVPAAPANPAAEAAAARRAGASEPHADTAAAEKNETAKREALARCLADLTELRQTIQARCVMVGSTCYDKSGCERLDDGRYQCSNEIPELTRRHAKAMGALCSK